MKKTLYFCLIFAFAGVVWAGSKDQQVESILDQYFVIQSSLAKDSTQGIDVAAKRIANLASTAQASDSKVQKLLTQAAEAAARMQGKDLKQTREEFFELSKPLLVYLNQFYSGKKEYYRYFCDMAKKGWIQAQRGAHNPYLGSAMPDCGELIS